MAPTLESLLPRFVSCGYGYTFNGFDCQRSNWSYWGRWVLAGICIFIALLVILSCCCISRRRRRTGVTPMYGTGWMSGGKFGNNNQQQYPMNYQQPPADYNPQPYGQQGYNQQPYGSPGYGQDYNHQQQPQGGFGGGYNTGVTSPPPAYGGNQGYYQPPNVPPPNK